MPDQQPWWVRIRGARAISWQAVVGGDLLISVAILVTGGTLGGYALTPDATGRALVAVAIAGGVSALWVVFGFTVLMRHRRVRPVSLASYVLFYAGNGVIYFAAVQWLDGMAATPSGIGWPARLLSSAALSLAWGVAFSLLLDSSDRFHDRRRELLDDLVAAEVERLRESREALRLREALGAEVDDALASTRDRLATTLDTAGPTAGLGAVQASEAAEIVRSAATDLVRPLSHQLHEQANASFPLPRLSGVLRQWWEHPRMPPLATALLVSSQTTAESVRNFGGVVGPLASLGYLVVLYLFYVLVDRVGRRWPRWDRAAYAVGVVGSLAMNVAFAEGLAPDSINIGDATANVLLSLVYIAVTSLFDAVRQAREGLIDSLAREVNAEDLRARAVQREMAVAVDDLARELHGRVQTRLVMCAVELERAARVGDREAATRALTEARTALESASRPSTPSLSDAVRAWSTLLAVHVDSTGVPGADLGRSDVISVVEEGLTNAFRHGQATSANVTIACLPESLRVTVTDDGSGFSESVSGLGSDLLGRLSDGRWSLRRLGEETVLTVDLPVHS